MGKEKEYEVTVEIKASVLARSKEVAEKVLKRNLCLNSGMGGGDSGYYEWDWNKESFKIIQIFEK